MSERRLRWHNLGGLLLGGSWGLVCVCVCVYFLSFGLSYVCVMYRRKENSHNTDCVDCS